MVTSEHHDGTSSMPTAVDDHVSIILSQIKVLAEQVIAQGQSMAGETPEYGDTMAVAARRDDLVASFESAMKRIHSTAYAALRDITAALRVAVPGLAGSDGNGFSSKLPGIDVDHFLNTLLYISPGDENKLYYRLKGFGTRLPAITIDVQSAIADPTQNTYRLLPTTRNVRILQHTYGRALSYKTGLIQEYQNIAGTNALGYGQKRNKLPYEDEAMMALPKKHRLGSFLDMKICLPGSSIPTTVADGELVLGGQDASGQGEYREAISGQTRTLSALNDTDLIIELSEETIKLLYELYLSLKSEIKERKKAKLDVRQGRGDSTGADELHKRLRASGLDELIDVTASKKARAANEQHEENDATSA
ncbi:hypothetical protein BJ170DRAFT_443364 [Xylariales sp. AK1849]|nr:hypothetical protein BJ170DRAFT_443364 [Xylariales sp. AK1849]